MITFPARLVLETDGTRITLHLPLVTPQTDGSTENPLLPLASHSTMDKARSQFPLIPTYAGKESPHMMDELQVFATRGETPRLLQSSKGEVQMLSPLVTPLP